MVFYTVFLQVPVCLYQSPSLSLSLLLCLSSSSSSAFHSLLCRHYFCQLSIPSRRKWLDSRKKERKKKQKLRKRSNTAALGFIYTRSTPRRESPQLLLAQALLLKHCGTHKNIFGKNYSTCLSASSLTVQLVLFHCFLKLRHYPSLFSNSVLLEA